MKNKAIFGFIVLFAMVLTLNLVAASDTCTDWICIDSVEVNDMVADVSGTTATTIKGDPSEVVPVRVYYSALKNVEDVRVRIYLEGYKDEIYETSSRFRIADGSQDFERFSVRLPSTFDLDDLDENLNLRVRITSKDEGDDAEAEYTITMQRDLYSLNVLSIDSPISVVAGDTVAFDVVIENNGYDELENVYVKASIPELGIDRKVYFGDISPQDECEDDDCNKIDTVGRRVYLTIPRNTISGEYEVEVEAYNYDTSVVATKRIVVQTVESGVLPATTAKTIAQGEEATFEVLVINPNDRMVVYAITPEQSEGLIIEVTEPIVTVSADSSRTVKVNVKATKSAEEGTHIVTINVNSEDGSVKQVSFTLNVDNEKTSAETGQTANAILILTVILVIIFVVLLIVLIVLLTRRPEEPEEFGETSYY